MADVLDRIVARKHGEVAGRLGGCFTDAEPTKRSLRAVLVRPGARFIMEVKRASPSGHRSDVTVEQAVAAYAPVADAISVLTDGADFGGSLDDLRSAREKFDGPILAKDFIVDAAQVSEARAAGADAVLVMMSVLDDPTAASVLGEAKRLAMDAIVEIHDEPELARALALGAAIVGINNRDLKTLTTDLGVTERLAGQVPADLLVISESGVATRADVQRLASHANAFLVGSALMAAPDINEAARALVHGRVKLCGLTNLVDIALAANAGATHAGLILVPGTPRALDRTQAQPLAAAVRARGLKTVGVFRDSSEVAATARALELDAVQLHGSETEDEIADLRQCMPAIEIWAACDPSAVPRAGADRILFDSPGGGSGQTFDWALLGGRDLATAFLAGGITPANAAAAARLGSYGLDIGSGVEASPGTKDPAKIAALFAALRTPARGDIT